MRQQRTVIQNVGELKARLRDEKDEKIRIKLIFLNLMVDLKVDVERACEIFNIATPTETRG
jgi:hypothetical protein